MSLGTAFRAFFATFANKQASAAVNAALDNLGKPQAAIEEPKAKKPEPKVASKAPERSEALTLVSTLQREARLLDLVFEPLEDFEDAQIGAAAREVLGDCRKTLKRLFEIEPATETEEGQEAPIDSQASPERQRVIGNSSSGSGTVTHRGWKAKQCAIPKWSGKKSEAMILAPIELEA